VASVAVGGYAGSLTQGNYSVAIGYGAGETTQAANSIVINANGPTPLNCSNTGFYVKPIRNVGHSYYLRYDPTSGEIGYW
jgi:hypothetical protein